MKRELYIGLMSGTSLDGIDAVLVDFSGENPQLIERHYLAYEHDLKQTILELHQPAHDELHRVQLTANRLARLYALAVNELIAKAKITPAQIVATGCHGQTIRHCPEHGYTIQIGNAALLAELTGISVISDFRSRDIAAAGQGAPLVPAFHDRIFRKADQHRVVVNIGGISNLTRLFPDTPTSGYDCGPGNLLMDAWCMQHRSTPYDAGGAWAATGKIVPGLLEKMLDEDYFRLPPPKSCGRDLFNMNWLNTKLDGSERAEDVQTTLLELTCRSIADAIGDRQDQRIYLCGGGAHNLTLHARLTALLPSSVVATTNEVGVDCDYLEAIAFAWLARQNMQGEPANLPVVTGARHPCILGALYKT